MMYEKFAMLYDALMADAPYDRWVEFVLNARKLWNPSAKSVLDLACGTGEIGVRLAKLGFNVTGVDLSADMLTIAQQKASETGVDIPFFQQNMSELELPNRYDIIIIFCDSLNYLEREKEVVETFRRCQMLLNDDGLLLFDVHSPAKIEKGFIDKTFAYNGEDVSYIWNCFPGEHPYSVEHELTFFVYDERTGKYERFDEWHKERTFPIEQYRDWLVECGFSILSIAGGFSFEPVSEHAERIFFCAQKVSGQTG